MGDGCRTNICPGDGGGAGNAQDTLNYTSCSVGGGISDKLFFEGTGAKWFTLRMEGPVGGGM